ncbi:MAG TPA: deoxyribonuclease IV, partial [Chondromyces sp.]|nr:deoxyribonuclease IV [Chondromyces sp.]
MYRLNESELPRRFPFIVIQLQCLAPRGHKPLLFERQRTPFYEKRLVLVGADQGASAFIVRSDCMLKIGSHVSMSGKKMLLAASEEAVSYGASTFMVYTGAPQNTRRKKIEDLNIEKGHQHMEAHGIKEIVVHAPYIINIGNTTNPDTFELGVNFLRTEIERTEAIGAKQIVLHPGAHVGAGTEAGIKRIIEGLNEVLVQDQEVQIALETMAGKGSECGRSFEEIAMIMDGVHLNSKLSVCFDTFHTHDA